MCLSCHHVVETPNTLSSITQIKAFDWISKGSIIAILDVSSLFTCIQNQETVHATSQHVWNDLKTNIPLYKMAQLEYIILNMNHFEVNTKLYLQLSGTTMDMLCALSLANRFMRKFEKILLGDYH